MVIEVARAASIAETPISRMSSAEFWIRLMTSAEFAKFQYGFRQNLGSPEIPPRGSSPVSSISSAEFRFRQFHQQIHTESADTAE